MRAAVQSSRRPIGLSRRLLSSSKHKNKDNYYSDEEKPRFVDRQAHQVREVLGAIWSNIVLVLFLIFVRRLAYGRKTRRKYAMRLQECINPCDNGASKVLYRRNS